MRHLLAVLVSAQMAVFAVPLQAEENTGSVAEANAVPHRAEVEEALLRGRQMFLYDQAAWHATDRMLADFKNKPDKQMRGYVVLPGSKKGRLDTIFYGETGGKLAEFARYEVEGHEVVSGGVMKKGERPPLSPLAERMVAARTAASEEVDVRGYERCNAANLNTLVLPPDANDVISAYVLTAPVSNQSYPLGGHYRVDVGPDGKVLNSRRFLNSCFSLDFGASGDHGDSVGVFVTHLLDKHPTEIHVFSSYYVPLSLMVGTVDNELLWGLQGGQFLGVSKIGDPATSED